MEPVQEHPVSKPHSNHQAPKQKTVAAGETASLLLVAKHHLGLWCESVGRALFLPPEGKRIMAISEIAGLTNGFHCTAAHTSRIGRSAGRNRGEGRDLTGSQ